MFDSVSFQGFKKFSAGFVVFVLLTNSVMASGLTLIVDSEEDYDYLYDDLGFVYDCDEGVTGSCTFRAALGKATVTDPDTGFHTINFHEDVREIVSTDPYEIKDPFLDGLVIDGGANKVLFDGTQIEVGEALFDVGSENVTIENLNITDVGDGRDVIRYEENNPVQEGITIRDNAIGFDLDEAFLGNRGEIRIKGSAAVEDNVMGNEQWGRSNILIEPANDAENIVIKGNKIGTDFEDVPLPETGTTGITVGSGGVVGSPRSIDGMLIEDNSIYSGDRWGIRFHPGSPLDYEGTVDVKGNRIGMGAGSGLAIDVISSPGLSFNFGGDLEE